MHFSEKDLKQIAERGSDVKTIEQQIENFKSGFPFMIARRAATIGDGMIKLDDTKLKEYLEVFENQSTKKKLMKFVPASGAASRMFKSLYAAKDEGKSDKSVDQFHENLKSFAFYNSLSKYLGNGEKQNSLEALLGANGLDYGNLPKGLLEFHSYGNTTRTAIEEHLVEGALYANNKGKEKKNS